MSKAPHEIENLATSCPVCGAFKLNVAEYCTDCEEYKARVAEARRLAARRRKFGGEW